MLKFRLPKSTKRTGLFAQHVLKPVSKETDNKNQHTGTPDDGEGRFFQPSIRAARPKSQ